MREDAYDVITLLTKSKELVLIKERTGGEDQDMCQALREWAEEKRREGKLEGKIEGRLEEKLANICVLMKNLKLTAEKAMDALGIPQEEQAYYKEKVTTYIK